MSDSDGMIIEETFDPTFTGSRQERQYIRESLFGFWEDQLIKDVLYRVQGGKEANVYCLTAHPATGRELVAAKVFRPRRFRAMRNDSYYKQGRGIMDGEGKLILDGRSLRALAKKTGYGRRLDTAAWVMHEYAALTELHDLGADVPRPIASDASAILMEFVGDVDGPAPILSSISLEREESQSVFERIIKNVETMLSVYRVHGDLSAYNVLYRPEGIRLIDFPQAVDAHRHPDAFRIFQRDIDRLCKYFTKQGVAADPVEISYDLWEYWIGWA